MTFKTEQSVLLLEKKTIISKRSIELYTRHINMELDMENTQLQRIIPAILLETSEYVKGNYSLSGYFIELSV